MDKDYGLWLQNNTVSTIDGSYGPFSVSIVSTNAEDEVEHEITYDSNSEFGYIIIKTQPTILDLTLEREAGEDNDIFGTDFNAVVSIDYPPIMDSSFRMTLKWVKEGGYDIKGTC